MTAVEKIKAVQRFHGLKQDGIAGPVTWGAIHADVESRSAEKDPVGGTPTLLDERTLQNIATLDPKAQPMFRKFMALAQATAAGLGCEYVLISGHRTWEEQDKLFEQRPRVTKAAGGYSNHNFGIAGDAGVFRGKVYLDESDPALAERVHRACAAHAAQCGLEWGGTWKSFPDLPHYELRTGLTMEAKRLIYRKSGSVL